MIKTRFFGTIETAEDLKKAYRKAAVKNHPDNGGDAATMAQINEEYTRLWDLVKDTHKTQEGKTYTRTGDKATKEAPQDFINLIDQLLKLHGITIEIIGAFVWITGDTKSNKDALKALNFRWHSKKSAWYLAPDWYHKTNKRQYTLDEVRNMYGVQYSAQSAGTNDDENGLKKLSK